MSYQNTKLAILAVLSLAAVAPAHAQPPALFHQEHILVGDLDLNSESGVKALRTRLERAARRVCPNEPGSLGGRMSEPEELRCRRDAVDGALQQLMPAHPAIGRLASETWSASPQRENLAGR